MRPTREMKFTVHHPSGRVEELDGPSFTVETDSAQRWAVTRIVATNAVPVEDLTPKAIGLTLDALIIPEPPSPIAQIQRAIEMCYRDNPHPILAQCGRCWGMLPDDCHCGLAEELRAALEERVAAKPIILDALRCLPPDPPKGNRRERRAENARRRRR